MKRNVKMMIVVALVFGASVALADKLSDFKDAASKTGCESIPYSDLRSTCDSGGSGVTDWCKNSSRSVNCGSDSITRDLKNKIEQAKKNVENLKDKKRKLEDDKSRATTEDDKNRIGKDIEAVDKDIYEAGKLVDQAVADLETRKRFVETTMDNINKCIDYRRSVMNVFASALDKVRGETDPDVVPYARQLRDKYEETKRGHEIAITEKNNALSTCKDSRP